MKQCTKCKLEQPTSAFYQKSQGGKSWCKSCHRADARDRKARYQAAGLCVTGCQRPVKPGNTKHCAEHAATQLDIIRVRKAAGKCTFSQSCDAPLAEGSAVHCLEHLESKKWARIKREYGLTQHEYEAMLDAQGGKCPITGDPLVVRSGRNNKGKDAFDQSAVVDHCHTTQRTRDILSNRANVILGLLDEDPILIRKVADNMIAYLEKWAVVKAA